MAILYKPVDLRKRSHERRERARAEGRKFYTGTPCRICGVMTRYVSTGNCVACAKRAAAEHYAASVADYENCDEILSVRVDTRVNSTKIATCSLLPLRAPR